MLHDVVLPAQLTCPVLSNTIVLHNVLGELKQLQAQFKMVAIDLVSFAIGLLVGLLTGIIFTILSVYVLWDDILFFVKEAAASKTYEKQVI